MGELEELVYCRSLLKASQVPPAPLFQPSSHIFHTYSISRSIPYRLQYPSPGTQTETALALPATPVPTVPTTYLPTTTLHLLPTPSSLLLSPLGDLQYSLHSGNSLKGSTSTFSVANQSTPPWLRICAPNKHLKNADPTRRDRP